MEEEESKRRRTLKEAFVHKTEMGRQLKNETNPKKAF